MNVERIGPPDPASNVKKAERSSQPKSTKDLDSINVSQEAKSRAEVLKATEAARTAPDIRVDRVQEAKRKLQDPAYLTQEVYETVADGVLKSFGIS